MFQVRSYDGSPEDLSRFACGIWSGDYAGRMPFPLWSPEYLDWQLRLSDDPARTHILCAESNGEVVGVLLGFLTRFRVPGEGVVDGLISSWLSVSPAYRRVGMVRTLKAEQEVRARAAGAKLILAYRYVGSSASLSKPPTQQDVSSGEWSNRPVGFWVRVIDPRQMVRWSTDGKSRFVTRLGAPFVRTPRFRTGRLEMRPFVPEDAPSAVELLARHGTNRPFGLDWPAEALTRHCCGSSVGQSLVTVEDGQVRGLVSFHLLPFQARTIEPVGILDIVALDELPTFERVRLLDAALATLRKQGAILVMALNTGDCPSLAMWLSGFIPWTRDSILAVRRLDGGAPLPLRQRPNLLWR